MGIQGVPVNINEIKDALVKSKGIVTQAAKLIGILPNTIYIQIKQYPEIQELIDEQRKLRNQALVEQEPDIVEDAYRSIRELLSENDVAATLFTLKCKAGWIQSTVDTQVNIQVNNKPYFENPPNTV